MNLKVERHIQGKWLEKSDNGIIDILKDLHHAILNIAPHNKDKFDASFPKFNIEYVDDDKWILVAYPKYEHIRISRGVAELVWCVAYSYVNLYTEFAEGKRFFAGKNKFSLHQSKNSSNSSKLLQWAYERWFNNNQSAWPSDLPRPIFNPAKGSKENVAKELTFVILSFFIHHELAHIKLHKDPKDNIQEEKEADAFATDWILDSGLDEHNALFEKQAIGIALGFDILIARCIHTGDCGGFSHPHSFDRLISNLSRYINDDNHRVWSLLCFTLKLHLDTGGYKTPEIEYESFRECIDSYHRVVKGV
jgi:hypothetical protein